MPPWMWAPVTFAIMAQLSPRFKRDMTFVRRRCCKLLIFVFFSRNTGLILTKLRTKHGIQVCKDKGPHLYSMKDNRKIAKIHWRHLKIAISKITGPISTKLDTNHASFRKGDFKFVQVKAMLFFKMR